MTTTLSWVRTIRVLSRSAVAATFLYFAAGLSAADNLASLVSAARATPVQPGARDKLADFVRAHASSSDGALAQLALGVAEYEQKDYTDAVHDLTGLAPRLPKIADYVLYYLGAAQIESNDPAAAAITLGRANFDNPPSPLKSKALILRADALTKAQRPGEAIDILQANYKNLPQPETDLLLATAFEEKGDALKSAIAYQRILYSVPAAKEATTASAALDRLRPSLGPKFPIPSPQQLLARPMKWMEARQFAKAKQELQAALPRLSGVDRERAQVRTGLADLRAGNAALAIRYLKGLPLNSSEILSERDEYLVEAGRRAGDDATVNQALQSLAQRDPKSPWRLKALQAAVNVYLVRHQPEKYEPIYRALYENFPGDSSTAFSHWRLAWDAYMNRRTEAAQLLKDQVARYPSDSTAATAMYYLGRLAEDRQDWPGAKAYFSRVAQNFSHYYYAMLSRGRLAGKAIASATPAADVVSFLDPLGFPSWKRFPDGPDPATAQSIARARMLGAAGLSDFAEADLRLAVRNGGDPHLIAMEMGSIAESPAVGLRMMKNTAHDYLTLPYDAAPPRFWQMLFPLPYRKEVDEFAKQHNLDPFMVAGLIRQESEFNPTVRSHANAYGLTQILPSTGQQLARMNGIRGFSIAHLLEPETNIRLGTSYIRMLLDEWGGKWEETLASYNAGKNRVTTWITWGKFREPAEFVESIPFNETRDYVQAVMRNAETYRELYGKPEATAKR